ncbi:hypothetical protein D9619_006029 [Psilocybe cf. subviscida]|uniref:SGNH hydrolase-type esterase domain-containing protein n=1 Tax=Psilocybe cf. subviscida TaxID=2480587 RepID=A0A8H5BW35_9AGAR|nr:hypothetical protein D9619_006029 [Psilocybe cf. subviscida]
MCFEDVESRAEQSSKKDLMGGQVRPTGLIITSVRFDLIHCTSLSSTSPSGLLRLARYFTSYFNLKRSTTMAAYVQDVFMLFGDSITQGGWEPGLDGFGQRLSHVYARKLDVLNRGYSGYNSTWGLPVFEQCIAKSGTAPNLRVLAIWFGANDACILPSPQHVPLPVFKSTLKTMVSMVHSPASPRYSPNTRILLISPPPINTIARAAALAARVPPMKLDREFEITRAYANVVREVAQEEGVAFVDAWTALWDAAGREEMGLERVMEDGLHLNAAGYAVMYDELMKTIARDYPDVHPNNLGPVFPPWAEIDWSHPEKSLYVKKSN